MTTRSKEVAGPRGDELSLDTRGHAERLGRSWANDLHAALVREKRRASGGWPGTLGEARVHVARALRCQGMRLASVQESEGAARIVYASARSAWNAIRDTDDDF
ncbi:MAG: hypothetical protein ABW217_20285 [Polyangiaceae bacterium]